MKKLFMFASAILIAGACFAVNDQTNVCVAESSQMEIAAPNDVQVAAPKFKISITIQLGNPALKCAGWWPVCKFSVATDTSVTSPGGGNGGHELPGTLECYSDEIIIRILKNDIYDLNASEVNKHLINVKSVRFGNSIEFPDEVIKKMGNKAVYGIDGNETYTVTSDKTAVYIHIPF